MGGQLGGNKGEGEDKGELYLTGLEASLSEEGYLQVYPQVVSTEGGTPGEFSGDFQELRTRGSSEPDPEPLEMVESIFQKVLGEREGGNEGRNGEDLWGMGVGMGQAAQLVALLEEAFGLPRGWLSVRHVAKPGASVEKALADHLVKLRDAAWKLPDEKQRKLIRAKGRNAGGESGKAQGGSGVAEGGHSLVLGQVELSQSQVGIWIALKVCWKPEALDFTDVWKIQVQYFIMFEIRFVTFAPSRVLLVLNFVVPAFRWI